MIYTVTFNPAFDYHMHAENFVLGTTNRSSRESLTFGGKGINVSVVLAALGVPSVALGFVAGFTGEALMTMLGDLGVKNDMIRLPRGMTRINVKIKGTHESELNAAGPQIDDTSLALLLAKLESLTATDTLVLSGSVPPSVSRDIYEKIAALVAKRGVRVVLDAEKDLLLPMLPYRPFLIKPNRRELSDMVGHMLTNEREIIAAARSLQARGARHVLVSLGGDGALLVAESGEVLAADAVGGKPVDTVGAGDSTVAGFLAGIDAGLEHAFALALAAGGATACRVGLATGEEIREMQGKVVIK